MSGRAGPHFSPEGSGTPIFGGAGGGGGASANASESGSSKIRAFGQSLESGHHEQDWVRPTNKTGTGATHVKSFHCKLNVESLDYLDKQINDWLDTHPDYEVKFVQTCVGDWTSKVKEPHMIVQVWV